MKRSRFSEEQIIGILKEQQAGPGVKVLCRKHGVSDATFCKCRSRYGGMEVSDARRLKGFAAENATLRKRLAEPMPDVARLKEMLEKRLKPGSRQRGVERAMRGAGDEGEALFAAAGLCFWPGLIRACAGADRRARRMTRCEIG